MNGTISAATSGSFSIGGTNSVHRLGFGSMRLTGPGIWGLPADRAEALRTLRRLPELGINFVDTADSYGPDVAEELIRELERTGGAPAGAVFRAELDPPSWAWRFTAETWVRFVRRERRLGLWGGVVVEVIVTAVVIQRGA